MKKQRIILPRNVKYIISELNKNGYRADIVGGSVRDFLLGKTPSDYDITTSASPEEMKAVFASHRLIETGIKHGTLTVMIDDEPYEITTYRLDGEYTDNRHPDSVSFTREVSLDLARRDFTVNAMCYNEIDGLLDLFSGREDLESGIIRAVGDAERRFKEDALRIFRALRFASSLDFEIEKNTAVAARRYAHLLLNVSAERVLVEWKKLMSGKGAYRILKEYGDIISIVIPELHTVKLPDSSLFFDSDNEIRELALFAAFDQPYEKYDAAMRRLKCDNKRRLFGISVLTSLSRMLDTRESLVDGLLEHGREVTEGAVKLQIILGKIPSSTLTEFHELMSTDICFTLKSLAINGDDLRSLGFSGKDIGNELLRVLYFVAHGMLENDRDVLMKEVTFKSLSS